MEPVWTQYSYMFGIACTFAFLDAWNIGANDLANLWVTAVSSRTVTLKQAVVIACITELSGAVAAGDRVSDTIRTRIVDISHFADRPSVLMLAMTCAIIGSSVSLTMFTRRGFPVSAVHAIVGGIIGSAAASVGFDKIHWGWQGVSTIFVGWLFAPVGAALLGWTTFLPVGWLLARPNALSLSFWLIPQGVFVDIALVTTLVVLKSHRFRPLFDQFRTGELIGSIFVMGAAATLLHAFFVMPYVWQRVFKNDWQLRWWMAFRGPFILQRPRMPEPPPGNQLGGIRDFYEEHLTAEELAYVKASRSLLESIQQPKSASELEDFTSDSAPLTPGVPPEMISLRVPRRPSHQRRGGDFLAPPRPRGPAHSPRVLWWRLNRFVLGGLEQDIVALQRRRASVVSFQLEDMHSRARRYDNRCEYVFCMLGVLASAMVSFVHGANDVSNSIGPLAGAYFIWWTGVPQPTREIPLWVLAFAGAGILLGFLTHGHVVMRNLGNRITLVSPSRACCIQFATAVSVLIATTLGLPVSTTQCITGATVGVGLANGDWRCVNRKLVLGVYIGWVIPFVLSGLISGSLLSFMLRSPRWDGDPVWPGETS